MNKVCFVPAVAVSNKYVALMRQAILSAGYILSDTNSIGDVLRCDIVHFNWFEGIPAGRRLVKWRSYIQKMTILLLLKTMGKKIIFTMHNKMPHESENAAYSARLMIWLLTNSDKIVIHCSESYRVLEDNFPCIDKKKIQFVPHPNYVSIYNDSLTYTGYEKKDNELLLLFMGQIRPYKNVEVIIKAANALKRNSKIKILICGKCSSEAYKDELISLIKGSNIQNDFRFIDDNEIHSLMKMADAVILPYDTLTALNSGVAFLAFSYGRTIISTDIGTVKDLQDSGLVYCYPYSENACEHSENLVKSINQMYQEFQRDNARIQRKGEMLRQIMLNKNTIEEVAKMIGLVYE